MSEVTSFHVTGDWRHIIDDGMVDLDALPDEALPTGHVVFTPLSPSVAVAGAPAVAHTLATIKTLIAGGELTDLQGREGVWLAGDIGGQTVRWRATTHLEFHGTEIDYPVLEFDLTGDVRLTGIIRNDVPNGPPVIVDPRIEALIEDAQAVLADAQNVVSGLEASEGGAVDAREGAEKARDRAVEAQNASEQHSRQAEASAASAGDSEASAATSARNAKSSETRAAASASEAAAAESAAKVYAEDAGVSLSDTSAERAAVEQIRDALQDLLNDSEAWAGFEEAIAQIEPRMQVEIDKLKGDAPEAFDTLGEVAAWIADSEDITAALMQKLAEKADRDHKHFMGDIDDLPALGRTQAEPMTIAQRTSEGTIYTADPRMSDHAANKRYVDDVAGGSAPRDHTHTANQISGEATSDLDVSNAVVNVDGSVSAVSDAVSKLGRDKANVRHTHAMSDVSGLATALDGKANASQLGGKTIEVVSELPGSPDPDVIYLVREDD